MPRMSCWEHRGEFESASKLLTFRASPIAVGPARDLNVGCVSGRSQNAIQRVDARDGATCFVSRERRVRGCRPFGKRS